MYGGWNIAAWRKWCEAFPGPLKYGVFSGLSFHNPPNPWPWSCRKVTVITENSTKILDPPLLYITVQCCSACIACSHLPHNVLHSPSSYIAVMRTSGTSKSMEPAWLVWCWVCMVWPHSITMKQCLLQSEIPRSGSHIWIKASTHNHKSVRH